MALHRDASASRLPSMSTVLCITEPNAVLPAGGFEGLEELIRRGAAGALIAEPPEPRYRLRSSALCADLRTNKDACAMAVRVRLCSWIFQAATMAAAIGTEVIFDACVARRESRWDRLPPYPRRDGRGG